MRTLIESAKSGIMTREIRSVSVSENVSPQKLMEDIASGFTVIPKNRKRELVKVIGIGRDLRTKINANIGTSPDFPYVKEELKKLRVALDAKTDTVMDLSIGGDIAKARRKIIAKCRCLSALSLFTRPPLRLPVAERA